MLKKSLALLLALAMTLGAATIALAADPKTDTEGSIAFKAGTVIVLPPQDPYDPEGSEDPCCPCYGEERGEDCKCSCHLYDEYTDENDKPGYKDFDLGGNLYFGLQNIGDFGTYDSLIYGTDGNEYTGIMVINQTASAVSITVEITEFKYNGGEVLTGAELTLKKYALAAGAGFDDSTKLAAMAQGDNINISDSDGAPTVLKAPAGSRVKASWSGSLDVLPGTSVYAGIAKATLTWTVNNT